MIHEGDEREDTPVNFSWIYYICRAKLALTDKESGRLTYKQFKELYQAYKDTFDLELYMYLCRDTYEGLKKKSEADTGEWLK